MQNDPVLNPKNAEILHSQVGREEQIASREQGGPKAIRFALIKRWTQSWLQYLDAQVRRESTKSVG